MAAQHMSSMLSVTWSLNKEDSGTLKRKSKTEASSCNSPAHSTKARRADSKNKHVAAATLPQMAPSEPTAHSQDPTAASASAFKVQWVQRVDGGNTMGRSKKAREIEALNIKQTQEYQKRLVAHRRAQEAAQQDAIAAQQQSIAQQISDAAAGLLAYITANPSPANANPPPATAAASAVACSKLAATALPAPAALPAPTDAAAPVVDTQECCGTTETNDTTSTSDGHAATAPSVDATADALPHLTDLDKAFPDTMDAIIRELDTTQLLEAMEGGSHGKAGSAPSSAAMSTLAPLMSLSCLSPRVRSIKALSAAPGAATIDGTPMKFCGAACTAEPVSEGIPVSASAMSEIERATLELDTCDEMAYLLDTSDKIDTSQLLSLIEDDVPTSAFDDDIGIGLHAVPSPLRWSVAV